jgi:hypothetical protein
MESFIANSKLKKSIVSPETVQQIFSNLPTILNFHKEIILGMEEFDMKKKLSIEMRRAQLIKVYIIVLIVSNFQRFLKRSYLFYLYINPMLPISIKAKVY